MTLCRNSTRQGPHRSLLIAAHSHFRDRPQVATSGTGEPRVAQGSRAPPWSPMGAPTGFPKQVHMAPFELIL